MMEKLKEQKRICEFAINLVAKDRRIDFLNYSQGANYYFTACQVSALANLLNLDRSISKWQNKQYKTAATSQKFTNETIALSLKLGVEFGSSAKVDLISRIGKLLASKYFVNWSKRKIKTLEHFNWHSLLSSHGAFGNCGFTKPENLRFVYRYLISVIGLLHAEANHFNYNIQYVGRNS